MATPAPITDGEHETRVSKVRESLQSHRLDCLVAYGAHRDYHPADLRYLARWYCVEEETSALFIAQDGPSVLLTDAAWDVDRARAEAFVDEVVYTRNLGADLGRLVVDRVRSDQRPVRVGVAGLGIFPAPAYLALIDQVPGIEVDDASQLTDALRMIKSPAELDLMRAASAISDKAMAAGLAEIRAGATEVKVAAAAEAVIREAGAEPSFVTEMGSGPRTALGTFLPGQRTLSSGEFAVLDCGARVHGYHGDMCRTIVVGGASNEQARKLGAVRAAVDQAIAAIRPGRTVGHIRDVAAAVVADEGYGEHWWDAFMPHGNGAGQHEPPNAKDHPEQLLEEGMVLCIEPGLAFPDEGAVIIEQMIAVGAQGAEVLNTLTTSAWEVDW